VTSVVETEIRRLTMMGDERGKEGQLSTGGFSDRSSVGEFIIWSEIEYARSRPILVGSDDREAEIQHNLRTNGGGNSEMDNTLTQQ
jgi:hypothetical protein